MANQLKEEIVLQTGQFDKNINSVIRKVEELKMKGSKVGGGFDSSMGKMIERATGFNGSLGSLVGTVTKLGGALGAITSGVQLADWFKSSVQEGVKLAEQGDGIRLAFERLNNPNLLSNLREQTHNTVTDLELMKQAIKFNDFKLPLDQIGVFLAFAQQKAKDTGESIDYMVNSIVTGLGRKSLPILDNLGLSANEIKERMKEGGDMTTAVANIIKDKMETAGGYVETAADRAKQKEVELQNELEELGRTFQPLTETSSDFWHSIEIGALKAINNLRPLINEFTELGRVMNQYLNLGGDEKVNRMIKNLGEGKSKGAFTIYQKQLAVFDRQIEKTKNQIASLNFGKNSNDAITKGLIAKQQERLNALLKMRAEYVKKANDLHNRVTPATATNTTPSGSTKTTKGSGKITYQEGSVGYYENLISELQKKIKLQVDSSAIAELKKQIKEAKSELDQLMNPIGKIEPIDVSKLNLNISSSLLTDLEKVQIPIKTLPEMFKDSTDKMRNVLEAFDMGLIGEEKAQELINSINETLISLGLKPIEIHIETDAEKALHNTVDLIDQMAASFSSLGQSLQMPELDVAGMIAGAIASVISGYATATSQAAALGPWAWIGFGLAGLAQVAAIIAQIHSLSGYANGGVIGGSSYSGDNLLARVNSGEMILNNSQQRNLFGLLDRGAVGGANGGNVNFVIKGKDLHGVLSNYNDKMNKVR